MAELIMNLLNHFVYMVKVIADTTKRYCRVFFELVTEVIKVDVHALVGQTNLVHHDFANLQNTLSADHGVLFFLIKPELVTCNLVQLHFFGEVGNCDPF